MPNFLIYGSYGYTGRLIAEHAVKEGLRPILAGRDEKRLREQAESLGLEYRIFALKDTAALTSAVREVDAVLHCAGPFVQTFRQMAEACITNGKHYVDISGEIEGFEALAAMDGRAKRSGVMLLPGAGFDVVPSDCLIKYLSNKLPTATHARIYIRSVRSGVSRGTARSGIENMHRQGRIRRDGKIVQVPPAWRVEQVDFGRGPVKVVSIGWGDVSTAYYSTGIPNLETFMAFPRAMINFMYASRMIGPLLYLRPVKEVLKGLIGIFLPPGPSPERNENGFSLMIAEVSDGKRTLRAKLRTPEAYRLTALTSVEIMKRILSAPQPGFHTPSTFLGPDFILPFPGVEREDL
ncbi:MAG: saccharopine dehydrogenase NADP-binding domain-containing protein [Chloroflexota bacterium]